MKSLLSIVQFLFQFFPRLSIDRLRLEATVLREFFPSFKIKLLRKGKIIVTGTIANGNDIRDILIAIPYSYPFQKPKLYMRPEPKHHVWPDGSVCLLMSWSGKNTISQLVVKAAELMKRER